MTDRRAFLQYLKIRKSGNLLFDLRESALVAWIFHVCRAQKEPENWKLVQWTFDVMITLIFCVLLMLKFFRFYEMIGWLFQTLIDIMLPDNNCGRSSSEDFQVFRYNRRSCRTYIQAKYCFPKLYLTGDTRGWVFERISLAYCPHWLQGHA